MNDKEKRYFIETLVGSIQANLIGKIKDMPEDWEGRELRQYIADTFKNIPFQLNKGSKEYREYKNTISVTNLYL